MIALYSGVNFFIAAIAIAGLFLTVKKAQSMVNAYAVTITLLSIGLAAAIYGANYEKPLFLLVVTASTLQLHRSGRIPKKVAVLLTLLPLLLGKITTLPLLAMLGLSFATFRTLDVLLYANAKQKINWLDYAAYLFFPLTLLAGPMYRWQAFQKDLAAGFGRISSDNILLGLEFVLLGIAQKFLVAEAIERFLLSNINAHDYSPTGIALNAFSYSTFLYFDFAGYSNMAVGIGKMLGLELPINFNNPILASNPQDFWRRWHISLSEWLRDVVFMPVYMTLCKTPYFSTRRLLAQNVGVFLTLVVMGIWNGLSLHYIVSGVMFGLYSVCFNIMVNRSHSFAILGWMMGNPVCRAIGRIMTIILAMLALYVFSGRSPI
ncbi:MBOAT family O-acyltransferase [Janthinobacterium sp. LB2P49]|uniref:MBOAT family O-acyltransferase n=1 Tax=Janthinobacterium sp. LB2P49 TaxID=3424198 RepID=UPI003F20AFD0